jgi:outer membrane protein assembly factor BamD (BamD/ComL family)
LCLLNEDDKTAQNTVKAKLTSKYADSYFTRLLSRNLNENLSTGKESEAQKIYAEAYNYYTQNNITDALSFIETGLKEYPNSQIEDKFVFLKTMLLAKTQSVEVYQKALNNFIIDYPKSQLIVMAKEKLAAVSDRK